MEAKSVMYAAVGAPVIAARKAGEQVANLKTKLVEDKATYTKVAGDRISVWAVEGEKVVNKISEGKVVEEISSKVDLDQAKEQVTKLRDQLEDMLSTWKASFRPEDKPLVKTEVEEAVKATTAAKKPAAKAPAAKAPAAKKPAPKTSAAGSTSPAAKASAEKTTKSS